MTKTLKTTALWLVKIIGASLLPGLIAWYLLSGEAKKYEDHLYKNTPYQEDVSIERSGNAIK